MWKAIIKHRHTIKSVMQCGMNYNLIWSGAGTGGSMKDFINSVCWGKLTDLLKRFGARKPLNSQCYYGNSDGACLTHFKS